MSLLSEAYYRRWKRGVYGFTLGLSGVLAGSADGASLTVTPSSISNTYSGVITLQINGLTNGEPVTIQRYLDANGNGFVNAGELLIDTFDLADGGVSVIGGVTNLNVPFDSNPTGGAISTTIRQVAGLDVLVGQQLFRLVSPSGNFAPVTNLLVITNAALAQSVSGTVFSGGAPVPNAVVVVIAQPNNIFVGGTVADNAGHYLFKLEPGTYALFPVLANYYTDQSIAAQVTLTNGGSATANLFLTNGSVANTLSGQVADATNGNSLGGVFLQLESQSLFAIAFTDASGQYSAPLSPAFWRIRPEADDLTRRAYVGPQNRLQVDLTTGSATGVNFALPKANALFYGRITDSLGVPFINIKFFGEDGAQLKASGYSDGNGNYAMAVLGGTNQWSCSPATSDNPALFNYLVSSGLGSVPFSPGQAVRQDLTAIRATAHIAGHLQDNLGNALVNVSLNAYENSGPISYNTSAITDGSGNFLLPVANGTWNVHVNCCGNEGLDRYGLFDPAPMHLVSIPPTNAVLNITAYPVGTPFLSDFARTSPSRFGFNLNGSVGASYTIQASTNLSVSNWFNLFSLSLTSSPMYLQDNQATNRQRFYRAQKN